MLESGASRKWAVLPAGVFLCCFVLSLLQKREFYFVGDPVTLCRKVHEIKEQTLCFRVG